MHDELQQVEECETDCSRIEMMTPLTGGGGGDVCLGRVHV